MGHRTEACIFTRVLTIDTGGVDPPVSLRVGVSFLIRPMGWGEVRDAGLCQLSRGAAVLIVVRHGDRGVKLDTNVKVSQARMRFLIDGRGAR